MENNIDMSTLIKIASFVSSAILIAGCNAQNSFSNDSSVYGTSIGVGSARFNEASAIIRENCATCHDHDHSAFATYTEQDFINNQYVTAGSYASSLLVQRLKGSNVPGNQNMPENSQLSDADIQTIKDWISGITP